MIDIKEGFAVFCKGLRLFDVELSPDSLRNLKFGVRKSIPEVIATSANIIEVFGLKNPASDYLLESLENLKQDSPSAFKETLALFSACLTVLPVFHEIEKKAVNNWLRLQESSMNDQVDKTSSQKMTESPNEGTLEINGDVESELYELSLLEREVGRLGEIQTDLLKEISQLLESNVVIDPLSMTQEMYLSLDYLLAQHRYPEFKSVIFLWLENTLLIDELGTLKDPSLLIIPKFEIEKLGNGSQNRKPISKFGKSLNKIAKSPENEINDFALGDLSDIVKEQQGLMTSWVNFQKREKVKLIKATFETIPDSTVKII